MGAVYLLYSAYFLSLDFDSIMHIMSVILAVLYAAMTYSFTANNMKNGKKIEQHRQMIEFDNENVMRDALKLKARMVQYITLGSFLFTFSKVLDFGVINLLNN